MTALMRPPLGGSLGILQPRTIQELDVFSQRAATSGMVPPAYAGKPGAIFIAVQFGSELGLSPMQSLINIAVVNNRPTIFADAMVALVRQSPVCEDIKEWFDGEGDNLTAWCEARRKGASPVRQSFSVTDAKRAGLWGKQGPWSQYPKRMLTWRARSWALRDQFADVLRGLIAYEEARDIPAGQEWTGPTIDGTAAAPEVGQTSGQVRPPAPQEPIGGSRSEPTEGQTETLRDAINRETPMPAPKRTARAWLDELRHQVALCASREEIEELAGTEQVTKALSHFKDGALSELNEIMADGMARFEAAADEDIFPGDKP